MDEQQELEPKVDDQNGVLVEGHIRIFDPDTNEDYVNKRS